MNIHLFMKIIKNFISHEHAGDESWKSFLKFMSYWATAKYLLRVQSRLFTGRRRCLTTFNQHHKLVL